MIAPSLPGSSLPTSRPAMVPRLHELFGGPLYNYMNAAMAMNAGSAPPDYAAGPIWAIFDADTVARNQWRVTPPYVDPDGYWFSASTLRALAAAITNPCQALPMDGATLEATVARYNAFVEAGVDRDFGKAKP